MRDLNLGMFKAYDIRTKSELLDADLLKRLAFSIARYCKDTLKVGMVLLARDARLSAPAVMEQLMDSCVSLGLDVLVNPLQISTCEFYYSCMRHRECAAVMITASHNPGNYIGCKLLAPYLQPIAMGCGPEGGIKAIEELFLKGDCTTSAVKGRVRVFDHGEQYVDYSLALARVLPGSLGGVPVFGEFLCGTNGMPVAMAFEKAGIKMVHHNLIPDGRFPAGDPNPIIESSISPAREAMKQGSYLCGFCFDGDGDRMDLMDESGKQIVPGLNMSVLLPEIMEGFRDAFPGKVWKPQVYADVKAIPTSLIEIARRGVGVHIIRNGHSFIKEKLREHYQEQYLVAEEESAHYYMNFPYDPQDWSKGTAAVENTLFFALLTVKSWAKEPEAYAHAKLLQEQLHREREWPLYFEKHPEKMENIMTDVEQAMEKKGASIIRTMDDGSDLDATLMRFGLPAVIDSSTRLEDRWCQVAQRISRSEDAMTRWEVVSNDAGLCVSMNDSIKEIADAYVAAGYAHY
mgnify:CR=1 FL=1